MDDGPVVADDAADLVLDGPLLVVGQRPVEREVEAQVVGRDQRAGLAGALADDVPQRPVEQVRAGVVAHRVGAPLGVDHGLDGLADRDAAVERAAMDDQPADRLLGVLDREQLAAAAGLAEDAAVADLAAALGVERGLGRGRSRPRRGRSARRTPCRRGRSPRPGPRRSSSRSRGSVVSPARAWIALYSERRLGRGGRARPSCWLRLRSRCSARAASNPSRSTATPYSAASSTVRSTGKPYVSWRRKATSPGSRGRIGRQVLLAPADDPLRVGQRDERLLELDRAGVEGPGELRLLAGDGRRGSARAARRGAGRPRPSRR